MRVWDLANEDIKHVDNYQLPVQSLAFSPDGEQLAIVVDREDLHVLDVGSGATRSLPSAPLRSARLAFWPDAPELAVAFNDDAVRLWNLYRGTARALPEPSGDRPRVAFPPQGTAFAHTDGGRRIMVDSHLGYHGGERRRGALWADTLDLTFQALGSVPVAASHGNVPGSVEIWDPVNTTPLMIRVRGGDVDDVVFSPDGQMIAICVGERICVRDAVTPGSGKHLTLTGHEDKPLCVTFSPEGTRLAAAALRSGVITIWALNAAGRRGGLRNRTRELGPLTTVRHSSAVNDLALSPDAQRLAVAGEDGTATIWRIEPGEPSREIVVHGFGGPVLAVAFSPDGTRLAAAAADETVTIYAVRPDNDDDMFQGRTVMQLVHLPSGGYATLLPDGKYKLERDPGDRLWWAMKLCRFGAGELDPYVPEIERLATDAPLP